MFTGPLPWQYSVTNQCIKYKISYSDFSQVAQSLNSRQETCIKFCMAFRYSNFHFSGHQPERSEYVQIADCTLYFYKREESGCDIHGDGS